MTEFDWTYRNEQWGDHEIYRIGASSPSRLFNAWNPAGYGVAPGETLWFSPRANPSDKWDFERGDQILWLAGTQDPDPMLDLRGVPRLGAWDGNAALQNGEAWDDGEHRLVFGVEVVPEPTTMTLLGIGLAGFATRRFVSRKKAE